MFCDDHDVVGADFVVSPSTAAARWSGRRCRRRWPTCPTPADRIGLATVDALADLHLVDPAACGLADLGRPDGFLDRQLAGWRKRWELVATPEHDADDGRRPPTISSRPQPDVVDGPRSCTTTSSSTTASSAPASPIG